MLRKTVLYPFHKEVGAKLMEFAGWEVPVQYTNLAEEHQQVRKDVGLFDVSHMGELYCRGPQALEFLQRVCSNDLANLKIGKARYSLLLNDSGGVVDDLIVYRLGEESFFICVNAANVEKDFGWLNKQNREGVELKNLTSDFAQIAIQGPKAVQVLSKVYPELDLSKLPFFSFIEIADSINGGTIIARTGYTGEDGFEVFLPNSEALSLWNSLIEKGAKPIGFGARDTLRLEAALPLHGHELRDDLPALSSNVAWAVKFSKKDFLGRAALEKIKETGLENVLAGLEVEGRGLVREGMELYSEDQKDKVGWVSSGTQTPTIGKAIGLAFLEPKLATAGQQLFADVRGRMVPVRTVNLPFYRKSN